MRNPILLFLTLFILIKNDAFSQAKNGLSNDDVTALENIIVEKYYVADKKDTSLPKGSVTYRIYADLKPGYYVQAVYGVPNHPVILKTTTTFYNTEMGGTSGDQIFDSRINANNVAFDSWLTIGVATQARFGILKEEDNDGSIIKLPGFEKVDGLVKAGDTQKLLYYGFDLNFFAGNNKGSEFRSENGSWASVMGGKGQTPENRVLLAQLTTNGKLTFELNLQIGATNGSNIQFVAKNPKGAEIQSKHLIRK